MDTILALKVNDHDNVATVFGTNIKAGDKITVLDKKGNSNIIAVNNDIPYGHKIAVLTINPKEDIIKYGEKIGIAKQLINIGDHAHVHNLDSMRGRGDL